MTIAQADIRKISAPCCELGEGPHYDRSTDTAWWCGIVDRVLVEHDFVSGETRAHDLPRMASVICRIDEARQLLAMEDGLYLRNRDDGRLSLLHPLEADNPVTRSNDGRVHPSGRLWIGTMGKKAEREAGAIYWYDGAEIRVLYPDITIPNSICFSEDGRTGYFADTIQNKVWRVALDPNVGLPISEPEIFLTGNDLPLGGHFDGSVTDTNGVVWNAAWGGGSVTGFAPDGQIVGTYELPAAQVSCPCFVGPDLSRMLVTTAWHGYDNTRRAADPGAGYTYVIDGGFAGLPEAPFRLDQ